MRNPAYLITLACAVAMTFLTDEWWKTLIACLLLGVVHLATESFTRRSPGRTE